MASFIFDPQRAEISAGHPLTVSLYLDSEGEQINATEGALKFPAELLEVVEVRDGNSVMNFWVESPRGGADATVRWSGVTPGGYGGEHGLIFSVMFKATREGVGTITIKNGKALVNDGQGTEAKLAVGEYGVQVTTATVSEPASVELAETDTVPPEPFIPELAHDPDVFEGRWFLVFVAQDKSTGIDHYEVREGADAFARADSPYLLKHQRLGAPITVQAYDRAGNVREATLTPPKNTAPPIFNAWWAVLAVGLLAALALSKFLGKRRRRL